MRPFFLYSYATHMNWRELWLNACWPKSAVPLKNWIAYYSVCLILRLFIRTENPGGTDWEFDSMDDTVQCIYSVIWSHAPENWPNILYFIILMSGVDKSEININWLTRQCVVTVCFPRTAVPEQFLCCILSVFVHPFLFLSLEKSACIQRHDSDQNCMEFGFVLHFDSIYLTKKSWEVLSGELLTLWT